MPPVAPREQILETSAAAQHSAQAVRSWRQQERVSEVSFRSAKASGRRRKPQGLAAEILGSGVPTETMMV
jgi:hypothetical protein